uniref:(California timema) hypothetical protein n=1 Tax=Timema californicum TaxID=61474 RepID=A0A7R9P607_TIMCA|nr:unnamed protein product [Timema californicum]
MDYVLVRSTLATLHSDTETVLPAGDHSFLFTFSIPSNLPSSFEGAFGYIRYTIKASLDRPWKFNQDTKVAFTVLAYRDLNNYPQLKTPLILGNTKTICCWCCQSAPMAITARVPFTGIVPGQDVPLIVELDNPTNVDITSVQCYLMQCRYHLCPVLYDAGNIMTGIVSFTGVVPGQEVPLIVELDNPTSVDITSVQFYMMQCRYHLCPVLLDAGNIMTGRVSFTGSVPGQDVPLIVELENPNSVDITSAQCHLMQVTSQLPESPSLELLKGKRSSSWRAGQLSQS